MAKPINLSNVNISLQEFQEIASGKYNAGEVKLAGENRLGKMNNHVETWWFSNREKIDHEEVLAIKQAFVKALSKNGVGEAEINRIRQELGLAPQGPTTGGCAAGMWCRFRGSRYGRFSTGMPRSSIRSRSPTRCASTRCSRARSAPAPTTATA